MRSALAVLALAVGATMVAAAPGASLRWSGRADSLDLDYTKSR